MFNRRRARRREELAPTVIALIQATAQERGLEITFDLDDPLSTAGIGLDSIALLELLQAVEAECGVKIPDRYWGTAPPKTPNDILDIVARL